MPRILIVDDDPGIRATLLRVLRSFGYEVDDATDGKAALDSVAAGKPDLIVLDWHMPAMDGIQTCRALRASSTIPVIMVSGNRWNSKGDALNAGAIDYLPKPFSITDLLARIEAALKP